MERSCELEDEPSLVLIPVWIVSGIFLFIFFVLFYTLEIADVFCVKLLSHCKPGTGDFMQEIPDIYRCIQMNDFVL